MIIVNFNPKIIGKYFDKQVRENCAECKRYGHSASCPPNIATLEFYKRCLSNFDNGLLLIERFEIDNVANWQQLGKQSSLSLYLESKKLQKQLKYSYYIFFGAGSCKLCSECIIPCRLPDKRIIPLEATGINVVRLVYDFANIRLKFPVERQGFFYRIGAIFYNEKY